MPSIGVITQRKTRGFTLLELAVYIMVVGILISVGTGMMMNNSKKPGVQATSSNEKLAASGSNLSLDAYAAPLLLFTQTHYRLPCPDTNNDGSEDCPNAATPPELLKGTLPFTTLALEQRPVDTFGNAPFYAVDFALTQLVDSATSSWDSGRLNLDDLCEKTKSRYRAAISTNRLSVIRARGLNCQAADVFNPAFVLVSGGAQDLDNINGMLDGENGSGNNCYEFSGREKSAQYDDVVHFVSMANLISQVCN